MKELYPEYYADALREDMLNLAAKNPKEWGDIIGLVMDFDKFLKEKIRINMVKNAFTKT